MDLLLWLDIYWRQNTNTTKFLNSYIERPNKKIVYGNCSVGIECKYKSIPNCDIMVYEYVQ